MCVCVWNGDRRCRHSIPDRRRWSKIKRLQNVSCSRSVLHFNWLSISKKMLKITSVDSIFISIGFAALATFNHHGMANPFKFHLERIVFGVTYIKMGHSVTRGFHSHYYRIYFHIFFSLSPPSPILVGLFVRFTFSRLFISARHFCWQCEISLASSACLCWLIEFPIKTIFLFRE